MNYEGYMDGPGDSRILEPYLINERNNESHLAEGEKMRLEKNSQSHQMS